MQGLTETVSGIRWLTRTGKFRAGQVELSHRMNGGREWHREPEWRRGPEYARGGPTTGQEPPNRPNRSHGDAAAHPGSRRPADLVVDRPPESADESGD